MKHLVTVNGDIVDVEFYYSIVEENNRFTLKIREENRGYEMKYRDFNTQEEAEARVKEIKEKVIKLFKHEKALQIL